MPGAGPVLSIYRAEADPIVCFRAVRNAPAQPGDFVPFAATGARYAWWDELLAFGLSAWDSPQAAAAATRRRLPYVATLDLALGHPEIRWAATRTPGHVTLWAPAPALLQTVVSYAEIQGRK